jgi:hypothetical protein
VLGGLVGLPADELLDQDVPSIDIWRGLARVEDLLGGAATPRAALDQLQSFIAHRAEVVQGDRVLHLPYTVRR